MNMYACLYVSTVKPYYSEELEGEGVSMSSDAQSQLNQISTV